MIYPNRVITKGESDKELVTGIQKQLLAKGCGPLIVDGDFGNETFRAIKLFQTRNTDAIGNPLVADGKIGPITWTILFGPENVVVSTTATSSLLAEAIKQAVSRIGVVEDPAFSNRGVEVDKYLRSVSLNPEGNHYSWCMAFVYYCFNEAAKTLSQNNPLVKTAGCLDHWNRAKCSKVIKADATQNPSLVKPGSIFIIDHGGGSGHTGIVESVSSGFLSTIEGNTNNNGSANGFGVMRLNRRKIGDISKGFLNYS
jgi:hypothetical protein